MTPEEKRAWRERYRAMSEALERVRLEALKALTDAEALRKLGQLRLEGPAWRERSDWSGLVEQQAIFHRRRNR